MPSVFDDISMPRRGFIAGALSSTVMLSGTALAKPHGSARPVRLNAWVTIGRDDIVTIAMSQSEMGQGISTTLPLALADELGVDRAKLKYEWTDYNQAYENPNYHWMFTGNSESISAFYDVMRKMGAAAREMLVEASARKWKVSAGSVSVRDGHLVHTSGRRLRFGQVAELASHLPVPTNPKLKPDSALALMGKALPRRDVPAKVDGSAVFGIDVKVPGMLVAAIARCPVQGGTLKAWPESLRQAPGVMEVVEIPGGLALVGERWWPLKRALDQLQLTWDEGVLGQYSTAAELSTYHDVLRSGAFETKAKAGDFAAAYAAAPPETQFSAVYELPFQAHATMEPMNCTAFVTADHCEIWAPTQGVELAHYVAKQITGLADSAIKVNRTYLGGGFGRRLLGDFIKLSILVSRKVGRPVKVIWSREEDFHYDAYRPGIVHEVRAVAADKLAMAHRVVSASQMLYIIPMVHGFGGDWTVPAAPPAAYDVMAVEGVVEPPYEFSDLLAEQHLVKTDLATSVWRTTGHGPNNFVLESVMDELAHRAGRDPLAFRLALLSKDIRAHAVLEAAAGHASWGKADKGRYQGLALAKGFGSYIAQVAEVSVADKAIKVHRVVSVVDAGKTLDPGISASNIEGGVVWGLSAMKTAMTFVEGRPEQSNFDGFDPIHLSETPVIETHFIESGAKPGGMGEIGPVPTPAAVCNAVFRATGERIRTLPISRAGFRFV